MAKILVVDDEPDFEELIKQKFRQKLQTNEYSFVFARNGKEAIQKLEENPEVAIMLSDINMPEMDGLTLIAKVDEKYPLVKTVIVSAYGDMANIRAAMNLGAFDFVTKPLNFEDLQITINKTIAHINQVSRTLHQLEQKNKALEETSGKLEATNKELDQILYRASHDLRGPISSIKGILHLFAKETLSQDQLEFLEMIRKMTIQMDQLLLSLDTLSKTVFFRRTITEFSIGSLIEVCLAELTYDRTRLKIVNRSAHDFSVCTDYELVKIVIKNILVNSIVYRNVKQYGTTEILAEDNGLDFKIVISDDGEGIDEAIQPRIYNMFFRGSERSTGPGLGLYIVKKITQQLEGKIEHKSMPSGTTFTVTLPKLKTE